MPHAYREGDFDGRRPYGWAGRLRAVALQYYGAELRALRELDIVKGPLFEARGRDALACLASRHFLWRGLGLRERIACAHYHYRFEQQTFSPAYVDAVYRADGLSLWREDADGRAYEIRLTVANDNLFEGSLSTVVFIDGQRVSVTSFSFVDAARFGRPAGPMIFVGRMQSGRHPEHLKAFARAYKHTSPPYFGFAAVAGIARALGTHEIAAIRHESHPHYEPAIAAGMLRSYDAFWRNFGASELDAKAFRVPVPLEMGDPSEVSAAHRARARKRREDRLAVEESAFQAIRKEMTGGPRPGLG
jgi:uncharacterized protein VirK/YbjX